jgi:hypothetical protein
MPLRAFGPSAGQVRDERGSSILEVVIASAILVTLMAGLMSMVGLSISTTENQGHLAARTTEYAQDKMEQLMALSYNDSTSDTRVFPAANSGGSGLTIGGTSDANATIVSATQTYVDYLEEDGDLVAASGTTPPATWFYKRVWQIAAPSGTTNLKQITVSVTVARGFGGANRALSTLVVLKTSPF